MTRDRVDIAIRKLRERIARGEYPTAHALDVTARRIQERLRRRPLVIVGQGTNRREWPA